MDEIVALARRAGRVVLDVYEEGPAEVEYKDDRSPLTRADRLSHEEIARGLAALAPAIPVVSEEGAQTPYEERRGWGRFFLVDPLDGTKEFIKRNGEFTVNIALVERGVPVLGVIYVPVRGTMYFASRGEGAWKEEGGERVAIRASQPRAGEGLRVMASRSHGSDALDEFLKTLSVAERMTAGSSLKFCLVAEGRADIYPRFGPTWEWDTAAGHAIVAEAGGRVTATDGISPLGYGKEILKHAGFICYGS
jgi:3'(2'), 5'-bisphosphate nucleotidase